MAKRSRFDGRKARALMRRVGMRALHEGAEMILTEAVDETPIVTGTLRRSGAVTDAPKEDAVYISFNTPYAVDVHEGFAPHVIRVVNAKVLAVPASRWKGGAVNPYGSRKLPMCSKNGKYVILGRKVNHPGFAGVKYLENPFNRRKDKILRLVQLRVRQALRGAE